MKSCVVTLGPSPEERQLYLKDVDRLTALAHTGLPDSIAEPSFDRLTLLAAKFLGTPVALVSLVDADRQFFKSCFGLPEPWASRRETPLSHSFCQHVVSTREPLIIDDARLNPLVKDNRAVADINVIAYLGIPLTIDGQVIGSFCAIDGKPRSWTDDDVEILSNLAHSVVTEIRLRSERDESVRQRHAAEDREQQFRTLAESIPQLAWMADPDGNVFWYNHRWYDYTGKTFEQMQGWGWQSIHDPDELPKVLGRWQESLITGEPFDMVFPLKGKDGLFHPFITRVMPVKDENKKVVRWFGTNTDITEAKRHEDELRDTRSQLQLALKAGRMGTWTLDLTTYQMICSDTCKQNYGRTAEEPFNYDDLAAAVFDSDRPRWRQAVADSVERNTDLKIEYRTQWPDGSIHWVYVQGSGVADAARRTISMSGVSFNIDERMRAENERERMLEQLQEHDRQKNNFLATLAHELRNPLAAISNAILLMDMSEAKEHRDYSTDTIKRQSNQLSRLIDDLLDISRISLGKIELRRDIIDATVILDSAAQTVKTLVELRKHSLDMTIDRGNLWVDADPARLEQIVVNLLNNAAKYSEDGGHIRLSAAHEDCNIVIRVKDAGIGITPQKLPEIFQLFNQADLSSANTAGGLGIGLALVKKLVELHDGQITATSEGLGKGSEFTVRLPASKRPEASLPMAKETMAATGKAHILVVDDNVDTVKGMAILLNLAGHEVLTAHNGPQAIELAQAYQPQCILLDLGLPGMSGYDVAKRLREDERCKNALIVAVSGYGQAEDRERTRAAGFDHHLVKPISYQELSTLLGSKL